MIARVGRKKFNLYAMDIETHNDEESISKGTSSMWLGTFIDETSKVEDERSYFYNMDEFIDRLEEVSRPDKHSHTPNRACIYIYNLSFEWSFLLPYLLKRGFKWQESIDEKENEAPAYSSISTKSVSSVWQVAIHFGKGYGLIYLRDLSKIYGGGLGKVAKAFGLPTQKGEIDYRLNRLHGHKVTQEEKEYCFKDTRIIIDILLIMIAKGDSAFFKSISMASYSMLKMIKTGWPRALKPYEEFRKIYPELEQEETDFLRNGVSGGITYAPTRWQFKEVNAKICHVDAHSMHPSSAYLHPLPYGTGEYGVGRPQTDAYTSSMCHIRVSFDDVILHSVIKLIGIDAIEDFDLWVWDFEIPTMLKCYVNLRIEWIDFYKYKVKAVPWKEYYNDCYGQRKIAKANHDEFNKLYFKLLINASYGKLLEKPHNSAFENIVNDFGIIDSAIHNKDEEALEVNAKYTHIPCGSAIPAYSRVSLIEHALALDPTGQKILYFDTDSIFFLWDEETEKNYHANFDEEDHLGGWAIEEFIDKAQFTAPKRYKTETDGVATFKMGGFNLKNYTEDKAKSLGIETKDVNIAYEEINIISSKWKVQRAYRCKGGTLIMFQDKEITVPAKYQTIYERNVQQW